MFNSLMLLLPPAFSQAVAFQAQAITPLDDVAKQLLNLGIGGVVAAVFFVQWRRVEALWLESLERERKLLLKIAKVDDPTGDQ